MTNAVILNAKIASKRVENAMIAVGLFAANVVLRVNSKSNSLAKIACESAAKSVIESAKSVTRVYARNAQSPVNRTNRPTLARIAKNFVLYVIYHVALNA